MLPDSPNATLLEYDAFIAGILAMCGLDEAARNEFLPNVTAFEGFIK